MLAVPTPEAARAEGLLAGEDGQVFDLVPTGIAAVGAVVADERAIAEEEEDGIGVEEGVAGVASEAVNVPSTPSWREREYEVSSITTERVTYRIW